MSNFEIKFNLNVGRIHPVYWMVIPDQQGDLHVNDRFLDLICQLNQDHDYADLN